MLPLILLTLLLCDGMRLECRGASCACGHLPDLVSLPEESIVLVACVRRVDEAEAVILIVFLYESRIESDSVKVLFNGQALEKAPGKHCGLLLCPHLSVDLFPLVDGHLKDLEHVNYEVFLDLTVSGCVVVEGGQMVYFEEPWLQLPIKHDVKAEEFVADVRLPWLAAAVEVLELRLSYDDRLDDDFLDFAPERLSRLLVNHALVRIRARQTGLQAITEPQFVLLTIKLRGVLLVEAVVSQMHVMVLTASFA